MISKVSKLSERNSQVVGATAKKLSKEVFLIEQQVRIARALASNDLRVRTKQLKKLKKWLNIRANSSFPFSDADFLRIWKGLFYCMWMSDKPLVQEDLAEEISTLLHCFSNPPVSAQFFGGFLKCMAMEWFGIDQWRMDKFLMLIRRMLRHMFIVLKKAKWKKRVLTAYNRQIKSFLLSENDTTGVVMHVIDIYLEELAKVADGDISSDIVALLIKPFIKFIARQNEYKMLAHVRKNIFYQLMWQSALGREFEEKFNAWREMGFPTESIDDLEKMEESDVEEQENEDDESEEEETGEEGATNGEKSKDKPMDPRAGRVDVVIPEMPVDVDPIIREFEKLLYDDITNTKSRKVIREILEKCKTFREGEFPLGVKKMPKPNMEPLENLIDVKVDELEQFEEQLLSTTRNLKKLNKKKRKKILQSIDVSRDDVNEDNFEQILAEVIPVKKQKLDKRSMMNGWQEEEIPESLLENVAQNDVEPIKKMEKKQKKLKVTLLKDKEVKRNKAILSHKENKKQQKVDKVSSGTSNGFIETSIDPKTDSTSIQCLSKNISKLKTKKMLKLLQLSDSIALKASPEKLSAESLHGKQMKLKHKDDKKVKSNTTILSGQQSAWEAPLEDGEIEYFVPSRKAQLKKANKSLQEDIEATANSTNLVLNPFAKNKIGKKSSKNQLLGKSIKRAHSLKNIQDANTAMSSSGKKRVKIVLQKNSIQKPSEYIKQVLSSPQVPFDATKKPIKSLLKPNLIPSPINPFYRKKIGLTINDTI